VPHYGQPALAVGLELGGLQTIPASPSLPSERHLGTGDGLTLPVKITIGVGVAAVAVLLIVMVAGRFLSSGEDQRVAGQQPTPRDGSGGTVAPPNAAKPAAKSTLASAADFLSGALRGRPKVYATPQEVFDAFWKAKRDDDLKSLLGTMAPDLREQMVAEVIKQVALLRVAQPAIAEGLQRYGVDFATVSQLPSESELRKLAAQVHDQAGFMEAAGRRLREVTRAEAKKLLDRAATAPPPTPSQPRRQLTAEQRAWAQKMYEKEEAERKLPPKLQDLVISGDTATGTCVHGGELFSFSARMHFVKIGESWYVARAQM
jgi:hypothetical protein